MTADPPVIETRGLSKRYRRGTALSEATITVPEGRISALTGPNGAGKTTLLRLLTGLPSACRALFSHGTGQVISCLSARGYHGYVTYQPGSRYWTFQGIETGIFVFLAATLIAVTAIMLLRRDA